jgi:phage tail sheath protein FI
MPIYYTPGVYFEKIDYGKDRISGIRTDIPGFVGIAEKGPLNEAVRLESWKQFQTVLGTFIPQGYLAYAVYGFFENGGETCYVVRIADLDAAKKAELCLKDKHDADTLKVYARNEGQWGNKIKISLTETVWGATMTATSLNQPTDGSYSFVASTIGFDTGSLVKVSQSKNDTSIEHCHYVKSVEIESQKIVWETALETAFELDKPIRFETIECNLYVTLAGVLYERFENLSLNPDHSRYLCEVIDKQSNLVTVEVIKSPIPPDSDELPDPGAFSQGFQYLEKGVDGLKSINIDDFTGDPSLLEKNGLRCYEDVDEISIICIPDIMIQPVDITLPPLGKKPDPCAPPQAEEAAAVKADFPPKFYEQDIERVQWAMIEQCERMKDRVVVLDPPYDLDDLEIQNWRQRFNSKYAALYWPWIRVNDPLRLEGNITRLLPPSGSISGLYARTDLAKGVHKAPANEEITGAKDTALLIDDSMQEILNPLGVNCLRSFPGKGVLIWGTRTISKDPLWKYINIRRLVIMIEESVKEAMQWAVFEPNDVLLRESICMAVSSFLEELWRDGALAGSTTGEAFYVKCDEENNPQEIIDAGKIITDIGVAPSVPGEFIVIRIGKVKGQMDIIEKRHSA